MRFPKSTTFDDVNHFVHMEDAHYEELQCLALGLALELDKMRRHLVTIRDTGMSGDDAAEHAGDALMPPNVEVSGP